MIEKANLHLLSAAIMEDVFTKRILKYNLKNCRLNLLPNAKTKKYGTDEVKLPIFGVRYQERIKKCHC